MGAKSEAIERGCYILGKLAEHWNVEPVLACGAVGCFMAESTCNPAAYNKQEKAGTFKGSAANGPGYGAGLAQWSLDRKNVILKLFGRANDIETWSMDDLIKIVLFEVKPKFIDKMRQCSNVFESTDLFLRGYENGGGGAGLLASVEFMDKYTWCKGYNGAMSSRCTYAKEILEAYMGGELGANIIGDMPSVPNYSGMGSGSSSGNYSNEFTEASGNRGVLSTSAGQNNIYSTIEMPGLNDVKHTRIYLAFGPAQKLSTLEMNINGTNSTPKNDNKADDSSTATNVDTKNIEDVQGRSSSTGNESLLAAGVSYPIVRINDYYIEYKFIESLEISSMGFVPCVELVFTTRDKELLKKNAIKDGDILSVFIAPSLAALKSLRCDFLITDFIAPPMDLQHMDASYTYHVYGELYVSNLYNDNLTFAYAGTSRDALIYAAELLKLGFFFNDPDNTEDDQMWYCASMPAELKDDKEQPSNIRDFIIDTTQHSWKNFESFYDSWIDLRYGLTYLNINKQLGEDGPDEKIDFTPWQSAINMGRTIDGHRSNTTPNEDKENAAKGQTKPAVKMISNIIEDQDSTNTFYCTNYEVINRSGEISREMGAIVQKQYVIGNHNVDESNNQLSMNYSMPYNDWKLKNGFYMMIGPGKNESYVPGDSFEEFVKTSVKKQGGLITDMLADEDGKQITALGGNMLASGSVNKFYDAANEHNRINNLQLQKKYVMFTLNGANLGIMRGEKIPAIIVNMSQINKALQEAPSDGGVELSNFIEEELSGWFIIDGLKYIYKPLNAAISGSTWQTLVKCIRREWPISGSSIVPVKEETNGTKEVEVTTTINTGSTNTVESLVPEENTTPEAPSTDKDEETSTYTPTTEGLEPYIVEVWNAIKNSDSASNISLKLGRWYAVDESGNACDGYPYVTNGNLYKVMDDNKQIRYIKTKRWEHYFGRAININHTAGVEECMKFIWSNEAVLDIMYKYGLSAYSEIWKAGMGNARTIHIGTNTEKLEAFWNAVKETGAWKDTYASYLMNNTYSTLPSKLIQNVDEDSIKS